MPTEMRLWRVEQDRPQSILQQKLDLESRIENWIRDDVGLINTNFLIIGQQVPTEYGGFIDLLAIDPDGNLIILELKRDRTPRDIVAQVLDYASWVKNLDHDRIESLANLFLAPRSLDQAFREKFQAELPEVLNERHRMYVVASSLDTATERIIKYLSETHKVDINAATFAYFRSGDDELLGRSLLLDDEQVQVRAESTSKRQPNRSWEELREMAVQRQVSDLYDRALSDLRGLFASAHRTRSNVALVGVMGDERNTIMGIYPDASSAKDGLAILMYRDRVCDYFGVKEDDLKGIIGLSQPNAKTWWPDATYFFDSSRLSLFIAFLTKAKPNKVS
jgi:hypothetical protein